MAFRRHSGPCQEKKDGKTPIKNKKTAESLNIREFGIRKLLKKLWE